MNLNALFPKTRSNEVDQRFCKLESLAIDREIAVVMEITPKIAEKMLSTSIGNRKIREWYVLHLASSMKRGEWKVTSQGIGIDWDGHLRDAHHRLRACIASGVYFRSVVVFGLDPKAYEVTDIGMLRTYADRLLVDRPVAETLRLGCAYAIGQTKPSIEQMRPIIDAGFGGAVRALVSFCGAKRKFYASAPMKLAACIAIMNGGDADFVQTQYKALCNLDFDVMTKSAQALVRQVDSGKSSANNTREVLARGLRVFDKDRALVSKIQISDADLENSVALVRSVLLNSVVDHNDGASI